VVAVLAAILAASLDPIAVRPEFAIALTVLSSI
jgi:hypothetical protein